MRRAISCLTITALALMVCSGLALAKNLDGDDRLVGTDKRDTISGDSGSDRIRGKDGSDRIFGNNDRAIIDVFTSERTDTSQNCEVIYLPIPVCEQSRAPRADLSKLGPEGLEKAVEDELLAGL